MGIQINGNTDNIGATDGSLSIEDIQEVNATGVITATNFKTGVSNLHSVGLTLTGGQVDVGSNIKIGTAGVITATSFVGSGANLTGITGTTINNNANNRLITGSGTANTLEGEATLTFDGTQLSVTGSGTDVLKITSTNAGDTGANLLLHHNSASPADNDIIGVISFRGEDDSGAETTFSELRVISTDVSNNSESGDITFHTRSAGTFGERLRIKSNGYVGIGTNNPQRPFVISNSGAAGVEFNIPDGNGGLSLNLYNRVTTGYDPLTFNASYFVFGVNAVEKLRITSTGQLLVGTSSASNRFKNGNGNGATPKFQFETANVDEQNDISLTFGRNNAYGAEIILAKHRAATVGGHTVVQSGDRLGGINFAGADGTHFHPAALIQARVDGTPGTGDMPGRLEFLTTADGASTPTERMRIRSDGHVQLQQGLTGLSGGGVIVCAAKSSSGTANQSNYKVDFVVPMADLGPKQEYEDIQSQFSSGQTGKDWAHNRGGSGILIATVQNDYYWGYRTKIYHITTYGNSTNNVTSLNLLHNYSAAGHGGNSASVDLTVQSHDGKTPTLRGTFSGDYWNSNILTVTYIGSAVASTGNIRQLTTFDSKLTGQDPTWK